MRHNKKALFRLTKIQSTIFIKISSKLNGENKDFGQRVLEILDAHKERKRNNCDHPPFPRSDLGWILSYT